MVDKLVLTSVIIKIMSSPYISEDAHGEIML